MVDIAYNKIVTREKYVDNAHLAPRLLTGTIAVTIYYLSLAKTEKRKF